MVTRDRIATQPLFADCSQLDIDRIAEAMEAVEVAAGRQIGAEREFAYHFFVIESGSCEVVESGEVLRELGPGDFFGEIGLLVTGRRTASVVATSPVTVLVLFDQEFRRMEAEVPSVAAQIRETIAARLATRANT